MDIRNRRAPKNILFVSSAFLSLLVFLQSGCRKNEGPVEPSLQQTQPPSVQEQQRAAALKGVEEELSSVSKLNISGGNASILAYLHTRPEFSASGIADTGGSVWARFTDGRLLIIANNRPAVDDTASPLTKISPSLQMIAGVPADNVPLSKNARVINAMGTAFLDPTSVLNTILSANGYLVNPQTGTVDDLMRVSGDGIFYFNSHGGYGESRTGTPMLGIWTATPRTPLQDSLYALLLDVYDLCYVTAKNNQIRPDSISVDTHYGITGQFVRDYMKFSKDCLIYIDACRCFDSRLMDPFIEKTDNSSGTYISWSNYVDDHKAYKVMKFVFDRLLGANYQNIPWTESPPQRPFDIFSVWMDMESRTPPVNMYADHSVAGNPQVAHLQYRRSNTSQFSLLAPSITFLEVDETASTLYVNGIFGSDQGQVTVDGVPAGISMWSDAMISCTIPKSGAGSAGDVIVSVRGHNSNAVQLTAWTGTVSFNQPSVGSLGTSYIFHLHFRTDVHTFRTKPHETPLIPSQAGSRYMEDTYGEFTIGGTATQECTDGPCTYTYTETWHGSQITLGAISGNTLGGGYYGNVVIMPQTGEVDIFIGGATPAALSATVKTETFCGIDTLTTIDEYSTDNDVTVALPAGHITTTMGSAYIIAGGSVDVGTFARGHTSGVCTNTPVSATATVTWSDFQPAFPPKVDAARKIATKN
jgi:hypothetical protein